MNLFEKEVEKAKKEILRGIWKKKPTPYAKVCGQTSAHNQALTELQNEGKIEVYSERIFIKDKDRELEYYRWVPFQPVEGGFLIEPLLVRKK